MNDKERIKKAGTYLAGGIPILGIIYLICVMAKNDFIWLLTYSITGLYITSWIIYFRVAYQYEQKK